MICECLISNFAATEWFESRKATIGESVCRQLGFYAIPDDLRLSVVIPVYNEEKTLRNLVERVREVPIRKEMILVNDCSKDSSKDIMAELESESDDFNRIRIFHHEVNQGKGAALRTGFAKVDGDIVIIQDADLEYDPEKFETPTKKTSPDVEFSWKRNNESPTFWSRVTNSTTLVVAV